MSSRPSRSGGASGAAPRRRPWAAAGAAAGALGLGLAAAALWGGGEAPSASPRAEAATGELSAIADEATRLEQAAGRLDEREVIHRLAETFEVSVHQVVDLREQKLALSDTAVGLAVAQAARKPVNTVLALWANQRLGWGEVAARLGASRGRVIGQLRRAGQALAIAPAR
jgi:hypothetical protein